MKMYLAVNNTNKEKNVGNLWAMYKVGTNVHCEAILRNYVRLALFLDENNIHTYIHKNVIYIKYGYAADMET